MVVFLHVDNYLNKEDYRLCIYDLKWPWKETHFVKMNVCAMCRLPTNPKLLSHFFCRTDIDNNFQVLFNTKLFWCPRCMFAIYDHYPSDECQLCAVKSVA